MCSKEVEWEVEMVTIEELVKILEIFSLEIRAHRKHISLSLKIGRVPK